MTEDKPREITDAEIVSIGLVAHPLHEFEIGTPHFRERYVVCPACDEILARDEASEHVCPIEEDE